MTNRFLADFGGGYGSPFPIAADSR